MQRRRNSNPRPSRLLESHRHAIPRRVQRQRPEESRRVPAYRHEHVLGRRSIELSELVTALFSLPFILFSMAGGFLADRFSKRTITISVKIFEMVVMLLALAGFVDGRTAPESPRPAAGVARRVFLMGVHSAFFGPSKYGLLPELLPEKKLSWGNGLLELGTFMAIILGIRRRRAGCPKHFTASQGWSGVVLVGAGGLRLRHESGHHPRARGGSRAKNSSANFLGDFSARCASWSRRPAAHPGGDRQHLFQFSRPVAVPESVFLRRSRCCTWTKSGIGQSEHAAGAGHRPGQRGGRLSFRRQNRIRPGAARRRSACRSYPRRSLLPCGSVTRPRWS